MKTALIIIDLQNDYFPNGKFELVGINLATQNAAMLAQKFRETNQTLIHIQHLAPESAPFFVSGSHGAEIHPDVQPKEGEIVVVKKYANSFRETTLMEELKSRNIERLVICGAMTHNCVDATTRAAFDFGYTCIVVHDACATRDMEFNGRKIPAEYVHASFMSAFAFSYGKAMATSDVINII